MLKNASGNDTKSGTETTSALVMPSMICGLKSISTEAISTFPKPRKQYKRKKKRKFHDYRCGTWRPKVAPKKKQAVEVDNNSEEKIEEYEEIEGRRRRKILNYKEFAEESARSEVDDEKDSGKDQDPSYTPEDKESHISDRENVKFWDKLDKEMYRKDPLYKEQTKAGGPDPFVHGICSKCENYARFYGNNCTFCSPQRTIKDREPPQTSCRRPGKVVELSKKVELK